MNPTAVRNDVAVLMQQFEAEPDHVLHVARLAGQLFAGLVPWAGLNADDALLLEAAADLHDIGWAVAQKENVGHHKATARLIRRHRWSSLTPTEVNIVALVARYHRKALPTMEHVDFAALEPIDQRRVRILAACLRVGDGLDRRHIGRVESVAARIGEERLSIEVQSTREADAEISAADKKADLLRQIYPGRVEILAAVLAA
jgi:exopolyphosphatase/guanosine-5'-triphosphate,3'-diphosphate pyrophosphatase